MIEFNGPNGSKIVVSAQSDVLQCEFYLSNDPKNPDAYLRTRGQESNTVIGWIKQQPKPAEPTPE